MAKEGRGDTLLVEQDFHYPATLDETGMILSPAEDAAEPGVIDDAVDEVIEEVMAKGGSVVFVDNGALKGSAHRAHPALLGVAQRMR